jgi:UDP:flavonoid glycosyltransferase YjiC (YdhE family)
VRVVLGAEGWTGHVFPAIALGRALRERGHEVMLHTSDRWAVTAGELGMRFTAAPDRVTETASGPLPSVADAARELVPVLDEFNPDVVVSDLFSLVPALAADAAGVARASLVPHVYPVEEPGTPFYLQGLLPPRGRPGRFAWRMATLAREPALRRGRDDLNRFRAQLGLAPLADYHGALSDRLVLVATFPQLEYERRWPPHAHVTGPLLFDLPGPDVDLPPGDEPLVLITGSTSVDPHLRLVETALAALRDQPVRVVVTTGGRNLAGDAGEAIRFIDWGSNEQLLSAASLVVTPGGHGTVARSLSAGVPVLVCPVQGDQAENGARVTWSGAGLMLPRRLARSRTMRSAIRTMLADRSFAERAASFADWNRVNEPTATAADLVERMAA